MKKAKKVQAPARRVLGQGAYRTVFEIDKRHLGKETKSHRVKKYGPFTVHYPMRLYSLLKFRIVDLNSFEFKNYQNLMEQVPKSLRGNFGEIKRVEKRNGKSRVVMKKVEDFDGKLSKSVIETGRVESKMFWEKINEIERFFLEKSVPFFDTYSENILVQWRNGKDAIPVLVDFKRIGSRTYPFKPYLKLKSQAMKRVRKLFARLRQEYKP